MKVYWEWFDFDFDGGRLVGWTATEGEEGGGVGFLVCLLWADLRWRCGAERWGLLREFLGFRSISGGRQRARVMVRRWLAHEGEMFWSCSECGFGCEVGDVENVRAEARTGWMLTACGYGGGGTERSEMCSLTDVQSC